MKNGISRLMALTGSMLVAATAYSQDSRPFRLGAIVDMTGVYSAHGGPGMVTAVKMAVEDFGGKVLGRPIEILSADYQNKVDITATRAREWYDRENVSAIIESTDSASALALQALGQEKKKITIFAGSASSNLTGKSCSPYGVHYVYDTYALAHGTGRAVTRAGGNTWFFITADYAFGHSLERDTRAVIEENGGKVLGQVRAPLSSPDFSSYLLQAQASRAKVIGLANAGTDTQNSVRQASEFGITQGGQALATLLVFLHDIKGMGLQAAQGLQFTTGFYWDRNDETRKWSQRYFERQKAMPSMVQAGAYSATLHYLNAVQAVGSDDADAVAAKMKETPINDFYAKNGKIRPDGRMVYDMYLAQAKKPAESKGDWDLLKILDTIPGDEAYRPLSKSECPLVTEQGKK
ncbi:urea ABC transporter%2C substrate-binding protein [Achromobacter xylosoxidans]|uniref:ABC transporter, substrate binding protein n=2 Tax=Bordetella petrii TaxID=94624 RepID=A9ICI3_BORPD|nr:ABC transporter substrate-binding protein [Achromobacter xylosoxidans]CAP41570.1 ABC transporter, substrate binding protein [Bordetella petrii]CUJ31403.1 urea ABC transporter%2C substrate-binding protein [Achromobacter xylosoxidans]CUJ71476.1 urea ABC transporter%2C substrate-binding protein [Achromobacter xylosoxidans]